MARRAGSTKSARSSSQAAASCSTTGLAAMVVRLTPRAVASLRSAGRGHSLRLVRTCIEVIVLAIGWLLGGTVGIGTVLYALGIGPLVHLLLPRLTIRSAKPGPVSTEAAGVPGPALQRLAD